MAPRFYVFTQRAFRQLEELWRWYQRNKNIRYPQRRRNTAAGSSSGGGGGGTANLKVFEVVSAAAGDGVYNCIELQLDATEWDDTAGDDKFDPISSYTTWSGSTAYDVDDYVESGDKIYRCIKPNTNQEPPNTTYWVEVSVEILNLLENDPISTYKECLAKGDRIKASQTTDDEGNNRWRGVPVTGALVRRAITTQAAPGDTKITANLYDNTGSEITTGLGSAIDVYCDTNGGGDLNVSVPLLKDNTELFVINIQGKWWCKERFNIGQTAIAYVKTTPGAVTSLECWFSETDGTGETISVPCTIAGGGNLNDAIPRLEDGKKIRVSKSGATWTCDIFQGSEDCDCTESPLAIADGGTGATTAAAAASALGVGTEDTPQFTGVNLGTGEMTAGSINRAAGTMTLEIGGAAQVSITAAATTLAGNLDCGAHTVTVNAIEVVGADGEVNKAAVEDSGNWDTAYGWGDHSAGGYAVSGGAEHDGFSDFVANEHIDWTAASTEAFMLASLAQPFFITITITGGASVTVYNANAPRAFKIVYGTALGLAFTSGGVTDIKDGAAGNVICSLSTGAADTVDITSGPGAIDVTFHSIAVNGSLVAEPAGKGPDYDAIIVLTCVPT